MQIAERSPYKLVRVKTAVRLHFGVESSWSGVPFARSRGCGRAARARPMQGCLLAHPERRALPPLRSLSEKKVVEKLVRCGVPSARQQPELQRSMQSRIFGETPGGEPRLP